MTRISKKIDQRLFFLGENISRAKGRKDGKKITLTAQEAFEIGKKQKWRCANSKVKLEFTRGGTMWGGKNCNPFSCSIDRIDNRKGYTKDNVQLVTWAQNSIRGPMPLAEYKKLMGYK
jgi:hypothetical protein